MTFTPFRLSDSFLIAFLPGRVPQPSAPTDTGRADLLVCSTVGGVRISYGTGCIYHGTGLILPVVSGNFHCDFLPFQNYAFRQFEVLSGWKLTVFF